jgi:ubiquinone/menaquinone biosynthesis C-methylase UbiE
MLERLKIEPQNGDITNRHKTWARVARDQVLAVRHVGDLEVEEDIFVLGSCFANEIRAWLEKGGATVHPKILPEIGNLVPSDLKTPPAWGPWDERVHYQCYTPFTIEQEINNAVGRVLYEDTAIIQTVSSGITRCWEPYRRYLYTNSSRDTLTLRHLMSEQIRQGLEHSSIIVFTLGLIEAFKFRSYPGFASEFNTSYKDELEFFNASYEDVLLSLTRITDAIKTKWPLKKIVFTVSPVPLKRTFSDTDIVTATVRNKSILRAAVDQMTRIETNVHYWPSYEFVMWRGNGFRADDLRHIRGETVQQITSSFCEAYFSSKAYDTLVDRQVQYETAEVNRRETSLAPSRSNYSEKLHNDSEQVTPENLSTLIRAIRESPEPLRDLRGIFKTYLFFRKRNHALLMKLKTSLKSGSALLESHGNQSREKYEEYGNEEMRHYEAGKTRALVNGRLQIMPSKEIRKAYLSPLIAQIHNTLARGNEKGCPLKVLEIGCGNGTNLKVVKDHFESAVNLTGIDISPTRIRTGKAYWGGGLDGVTMIEADATNLSGFGDSTFDIVFSICALEQIPYRLNEVVSEMVRVSKEIIVCVEPIPQWGNETQRLYNLINDQCRTLLLEFRATNLEIFEGQQLPVLHNPLNPVGLLIGKHQYSQPNQSGL